MNAGKTELIAIVFLWFVAAVANAQSDSAKAKIPFEGMDLTWINGQNRQRNFPLVLTDRKTGETVCTGVAYFDGYYNYNFARPIDNTQTISSTIGRSNEFTLNLASIGIESNYKNIIGRVWLQAGQMLSIVQDLDQTVHKGRNTPVNNVKFIREAAAGYHFDKWYGLNVEMGIFMSYIGLESYMLQENWSYQRSLVCEFTPFYFSGARVQAFPAKKYKVELWLMNGWQTYSNYNQGISVGASNYYRPSENVQLVANFYCGRDTRNSSRIRFHHDNSIVVRYFKNRSSNGISQAGLSLNMHYGFQSGDGVTASEQYMTGFALANRLWFAQNKLGLTFRVDALTNPGLYLAPSPSDVKPNAFTLAMSNDPKQQLNLFQSTVTFDVMPNDHVTFRFEYGFRQSNVPYFAGPGGTTSPDGWSTTPIPPGWQPDLRKTENRLLFAMDFRL
ncbi:MAG TPA: outer membrane beta-barrel protein [Cyclobacteriaceae bacterium]|nr:outer membrane beta-barrel protein [Cyclobacteriaceae bacterium]